MTARFDHAYFAERRVALGLTLGHPAIVRTQTPSTNDDALVAASAGQTSGAVFVADEQTTGRGRRGSAWVSPPGENLTFTLLLRPRRDQPDVGCMPLVVGLAVRAAIAARVAAPVGVKWPNDVLAGGSKIAGILVESHLHGARIDALAVGVGVNVQSRHFPAHLQATAVSLAALGDESATREDVLAEILAQLEDRLTRFEALGFAPLADEMRGCDLLDGQPVRVDAIAGTARGIGASGALLVEDAAGRLHAVTSGTVQWDAGWHSEPAQRS